MSKRSDPEKRGRIQVAARRAFLERGYAGSRMASIAEAAGLAVGTIYLYFKSKEDLALSLEDIFFEHISDEVVPLLPKVDTPEGIEEIFEASLRVTVEDADLLRIRTYIPDTPSRVRERCVQLISHSLEEKMREGSIRRYAEPEVLSEFIFVIVEQSIQKSLSNADEDVRVYREVATQMIQRVLLF